MAGLILSGPESGSGKTVVTLGLLRYLRNRGVAVAAAKSGPDYIDPSFLGAASGAPCRNLDSWAMRGATLAAAIAALERSGLVLCEGAMGLFDGAGMAGAGSTADLAAQTGWPVVLVVDAARQAQSVAALVGGFAGHRKEVAIAGVIFNRTGSERHAAILTEAVRRANPAITILGAVPRAAGLDLPVRHLGLVPAGEHGELDAFLNGAAEIVGASVDTASLLTLARPSALTAEAEAPLPRLGARIAVARDRAFVFAYDAVLQAWRDGGASLSFFSPLGDEAPDGQADAIYLPGGYPELFAAEIADSSNFLSGLRLAARQGAAIYGECGGYMVLGQALTDAAGKDHAMAGLLPVRTSFATKRLHLGYRQVSLCDDGVLGKAGAAFRGHEFHYATIAAEGDGAPLFRSADADGRELGLAGRVAGKVIGSFVHLVDKF